MKLQLRYKLMLVYSALFLASTAALQVATYWAVSTALDSLLVGELTARRAVVEEYVGNHVRRMAWPELSVALAAHRGFQPEWILIEDAAGRRLFTGPRLRDALADPEHTPARTLRETRRIHGQDYVLVTGMDSSIPAAVLERLRWLMLLSAPLLVLLACGAGYGLARGALRPVQQIADEAQSIDAHRLATRLEVPQTRDELQRLAETINRMLDRIESGFRQVSQFTANASHELRTPLAIIRSTAEVGLLHPATVETPERKALARILRQAERNSQLLDDMLRLARHDAGRERLVRSPLDLNRSLRTTGASFLTLGAQQGLDIRIHTHPEPCLLEGDEAYLRRLWTILLDNALKYTPAGGRIDLTVARNGDRQAVCTVRDTGCGIAPQHLPHIFERFYRADSARATGGFGLGLSLARQIAEDHGAVIEVESVAGQGTAFHVRFAQLLPLEAISGDPQVHNIALK